MRLRHFFISTLFLLVFVTSGHAQTIKEYDSISDGFYYRGLFDSALVYARKSEPLYIQQYGINSRQYAYFVGQYFAMNYEAKGDLQNAEYWYRRSDTLFSLIKDTASNQYGENLINLGNLCNGLGSYAEAIPMFEKALNVIDSRNINGIGAATNNLAISYNQMGEYTASEQTFLRLIDTVIKHPELQSLPPLAALYQNLGTCARKRGDYEEAEKRIKTAIDLFATMRYKQKELDEARLNLASVLVENGKTDSAYKIYKLLYEKLSHSKKENLIGYSVAAIGVAATGKDEEKAFNIFVEVINLTNNTENKAPPYFVANYHLAKWYISHLKYTIADSVFRKVLKDYDSQINRDEYYYQIIYDAFCENLLNLNHLSEAKKHLDTLTERVMFFLRKNLPGLSEDAQSQLVQSAQVHFNLLFRAVALQHNDTAFAALALRQLLQYKSVMFTIQSRMFQSLRSSGNEQIKNLSRQYISKKQIAAKITNTQVTKDKAEKEAIILEGKLARLSGIGLEPDDNLLIKKIKDRLDVNEAAVEFVRYYEPTIAPALLQSVYGAFVLQKNKPVNFVLLCTEGDLHSFLSTDTSFTPEQQLAYNDAEYTIYNKIWKPIAALVPSGCTVYYSPDATLNYFSLKGIKAPNGQYLLDQYSFYTVSNCRSLALKKPEQPLAMNVTLWGMVNESATVNAAATKSAKPFRDTETRIIDSLCKANKIKVKAFVATNASEKNFKQFADFLTPITHLSIHGLYSPALSKAGNDSVTDPYTRHADPLYRCALLFDENTNKATTSAEDGRLTGKEMALLNLANVQLLVLSACMSGLGDVGPGSEGVWGFQQACKIAGAKKIIVTLWEVKPEPTAIFMKHFYKCLENDKKHSPTKALQQAQKIMQQDKKYHDPYNWAGFVLVE